MGNYRLSDSLEHEVFYVHPKTFRISVAPFTEGEVKYDPVSIDYKIPSFAKLQEMQSACTIPLFNAIDDNKFAMELLRECLKSISCFELSFVGDKDLANKYIDQKSFDEMVGDKGLPPSILAHVVRIIRSRL